MTDAVTALSARWTVIPGTGGGLDVIENATVLVRGQRILDVVRNGYGGDAVRRIEWPQGILFPGFVNLHNHSINGPIFRGLVDDSPHPADTLVYGLLLPLGDLTGTVWSEDDIRAVYRLALTEILRSGATTLLDMPRTMHSPLFDVAKDMGVRLFGTPYIFSTPTSGVDEVGRPVYGESDEIRSFEAALRIAEEYDEGPGGRIRVGFGPHATDTCSPTLLRRITEHARQRRTVVSIHVAQSHHEVETVRRRHGSTPVKMLHDAGVLGPHVVAAHCVYADSNDLELLRDTGTTVAHCPLTFARSGVTVSFDRFHRHGVPTGIGTDAYNFDFFSEMRAAGFISKLTNGDAAVATAPTLLRAASEAGAAALGQSDLGRIAPGCLADLVVVNLGSARLAPVRDPLRNLVWNATPADVSLVMVDGRIVVEHGVVRGHDESEVVRAATDAVQRLWTAAERKGVLVPRGKDNTDP